MKGFIYQKLQVLFFVSYLCQFQCLFAADEWVSTDVRSFSLGNIHAIGSEWLNPAAIAFSEQKRIGLSISNRFQMSELNTAALYLASPNKRLDMAFRAVTFGYEDYRLTQMQGNFAKQVFADFAIGIHLAYLHESSIMEEESSSAFSSGLGIYHRLNEQLDWAVSGENLLTTQKDLPWNVYAGIQYRPADAAGLFLEAGYNKENALHFSAGFEYLISDALILRSGYHSGTRTPSFGVAYLWDCWTVDVGFSIHSVLGASAMIGVSYKLTIDN
jgi:hypothetical protein